KAGRVNLGVLLKRLAGRGIASVLVEGGGEVNADFILRNLADEIFVFVAPKLIGGRTAPTLMGGAGFSSPATGVRIRDWTVEPSGGDFLIHGQIDRRQNHVHRHH
ncbi:MAG: dihydrofolate reductase family protein, partial [Candidatus Omnitrophica bacterium]|nr:dihydrofolate reductase family protein [Candidatus Omnitrophota bacterium]